MTTVAGATEREKIMATCIASTIMYILNVPSGVRTSDAVAEILTLLRTGLKEASDAPQTIIVTYEGEQP